MGPCRSWRRRGARSCRHGGLLHLGVALLELGAALRSTTGPAEADPGEPPLHGVLDGEEGGGTPQDELERGEDGGGTGGSADGTTAEEQLVQEDAQGDEAGKVEEDVSCFQGEDGPWVVDYIYIKKGLMLVS